MYLRPTSIFALAISIYCLSLTSSVIAEQRGSAPISESRCQVGVFESGDKDFVALTKNDRGFSYFFKNGYEGKVASEGSPVACMNDHVVVADAQWQAMQLTVVDSFFESGDTRLFGRLMTPPNANAETPLLVFAHGSERVAWVGAHPDPYQVVARGVSVFVYDKRGTGKSTGQYSQNFPELAGDLVAASKHAQGLLKQQYGRFGLIGLSQGGWIVPLAANQMETDFVSIGYGLVVDIREEDGAQVAVELRSQGFSEAEILLAKKVTDLTAKLISSRYTDGLNELETLRRKYGDQAWFAAIKGDYSGIVLGHSAEQLRTTGIPLLDDLNFDFSVDPVETIRKVKVPQLWMLAGEDRAAPIAETNRRLKALSDKGSDITIYTFPDTDHGMIEYVQNDDGSRDFTRVTDGYYDLIADWAKGRLSGDYGAAFKTEL